MIIGRELIDKYYDEKLYSTGNDELDDILERAFCDGYEYAQREFANYQLYDDSNILKNMKDADILAESKKKGIRNKAYNTRLKEAQKQALRREKKDWKMNVVQRESYTY